LENSLAFHFKLNTSYWAGGVAQVVRHLPSKCKALSLNPTTAKKKKPKTSKEVPAPELSLSTSYPKHFSLFHSNCLCVYILCLSARGFFFFGTVIWTQGLHLEPLNPFFVMGFSETGSCKWFAEAGFEPQSSWSLLPE
jgi:hypothetical protein